MRGLYIVGGLVVVAVAAWLLFFNKPAVTNYPSAGTDIVALGDSLVFGTGSKAGGGFVPIVSQEVGAPIVNLGVPGDTTADVLARIKILDKYAPKVVILLVGGNDYLRQMQDDTVFENVGKIIEEIQARGAIVLLVGIRGGVLADPYAPRFKELRERYGTAYVPNALQGLLGNEEYMADTVHPNDEGYKRLAARIAPVLKDLLQ